MKRVEVLIVDDMKGSTKVDETQITELLKQINEKVDKVVINKVTIPTASEDEDNLLGVHIIVREVAET
ncbi:MAG: hypothetical protein RXQ78_00920 [Sulfolobaceae archaeon]|jgi:DNA replication protein DnaC|uniref:Uncharacterized protein n=1 Tax=Stygiolobus azoricus TaxID=41675 RepID=A0A650CNN7_9CREN|nr:hypothetical protein [Stygiolobus azoricus]MDT7872468.1 hypothetical protein [Sulfolobaceae archaeon]QGR19305.1 hypothetical protein D1868_04445 [Stygiolobus azoricus]